MGKAPFSTRRSVNSVDRQAFDSFQGSSSPYQSDSYHSSTGRSTHPTDSLLLSRNNDEALGVITNLKSDSSILSSRAAESIGNKTAFAANRPTPLNLVNSRWASYTEQKIHSLPSRVSPSQQTDGLAARIYFQGLDGLETADMKLFLIEHTPNQNHTKITWCNDNAAVVDYGDIHTTIEALKLLSTGSKDRSRSYSEFRLAQPYSKDRLRPINMRLATLEDTVLTQAKPIKRDATLHKVEALEKPGGQFNLGTPHSQKVSSHAATATTATSALTATSSNSQFERPVVEGGSALFSAADQASLGRSGMSKRDGKPVLKVRYGVSRDKPKEPSAVPLFSVSDAFKNFSQFQTEMSISPISKDNEKSPTKDTSSTMSSELIDVNGSVGQSARSDEPAPKKGSLFSLPLSLTMAGPQSSSGSRPLLGPLPSSRPQPALGPEELSWNSRTKRRIQHLNTHFLAQDKAQAFLKTSSPSHPAIIGQHKLTNGSNRFQPGGFSPPVRSDAQLNDLELRTDELQEDQRPKLTPKPKSAALLAEAVKRWSQAKSEPNSPDDNPLLRESSRSPLSFKQKSSPSGDLQSDAKSLKPTEDHLRMLRGDQAANTNEPTSTGFQIKGRASQVKKEVQSSTGLIPDTVNMQKKPLSTTGSGALLNENSVAGPKKDPKSSQASQPASSFEWSFDDEASSAVSQSPEPNTVPSEKVQEESEPIIELSPGEVRLSRPGGLDSSAKNNEVEIEPAAKSQPLKSTRFEFGTPQPGRFFVNMTANSTISPPLSSTSLRPDVAPFFPSPSTSASPEITKVATPASIDMIFTKQALRNQEKKTETFDRLMDHVTSLEAQLKILRDEILAGRAKSAEPETRE